jgi:peptidyl-prolyl cis-trans isomerase D
LNLGGNNRYVEVPEQAQAIPQSVAAGVRDSAGHRSDQLFGPGIKQGVVGSSSGNDTVIAKVANYEITLHELRDGLAAFGQQLAMGQGSSRMEDPTTTYRLYGTQVLDSMIRDKIVQYEAEQRNIGATDHEVQEKLKQIFAPWPGPEAYRARLAQARQGLTPAKFEDSLRAQIAQEKLRSYITAPIQVADKEVEEEFRRNHTDYAVRWVEVTADKFRDQVRGERRALSEFFQQHKDEFKINSEERRARYILIDMKKAGDAVQISDDELKKNFVPEQNVQQVRVSQIVLNIPKAKAEPAKDAAKDAKKEDSCRRRTEGRDSGRSEKTT